jgi:hypothetical protein
MANELCIADLVAQDMARSLSESIAPLIADMKAAGMTNDEINLELNRALFDSFRGLHGFPDSHRP